MFIKGFGNNFMKKVGYWRIYVVWIGIECEGNIIGSRNKVIEIQQKNWTRNRRCDWLLQDFEWDVIDLDYWCYDNFRNFSCVLRIGLCCIDSCDVGGVVQLVL